MSMHASSAFPIRDPRSSRESIWTLACQLSHTLISHGSEGEGEPMGRWKRLNTIYSSLLETWDVHLSKTLGVPYFVGKWKDAPSCWTVEDVAQIHTTRADEDLKHAQVKHEANVKAGVKFWRSVLGPRSARSGGAPLLVQMHDLMDPRSPLKGSSARVIDGGVFDAGGATEEDIDAMFTVAGVVLCDGGVLLVTVDGCVPVHETGFHECCFLDRSNDPMSPERMCEIANKFGFVRILDVSVFPAKGMCVFAFVRDMTPLGTLADRVESALQKKDET